MIKRGSIDVLIDTGPTAVVAERLGERLGFFDRDIELLILTHPDQDHIGGALEVMERYRVERLMATFIADDNATYKALLELADAQRIQKLIGKAGVRVRIGDVARMDVLYPFEDLSGARASNTNGTSIVVRLAASLRTFLFTGDLEAAQEYELLARHMSVAADVLKLGHHGSKTSSTAQFLSAVDPSIAVISAGAENRYGHPHQEVLDRAGAVAGSILRTYGGGDVVIDAE